MSPRKNESETLIRNVLVRFCKEQFRRGPRETRVFLVGDWILVWVRGLLASAELDLASQDSGGRAGQLLRELFSRLVEHSRQQMETALATALGSGVRVVHADLCPQADEGFLLLALTETAGSAVTSEENPEKSTEEGLT